MRLYLQRPSSKHDRSAEEHVLVVEGSELYRFQTPPEICGNINTTIHRVDGGSSRQIAKIEWNSFPSTTIYIDGEEMSCNRFLRKSGLCFTNSRSRLLRGANGVTYKWKTGDGHSPKLELFDPNGARVAKFFRRDDVFATEEESAEYLEVRTNEAQQTLDVIVISFYFLAEKKTAEANHLRPTWMMAS
ncbi:hypothetical protein BD410DRAFT_788467 [Rickenella mellea]|uniref:DUF6593 domain-containing protein n=1 Tax=Rickenella mellea TaxID=50990 RepID=A0A4Y7Q6Y0_9AGAM|nr:hypothetical protein BD410DRAFT_788467 [Rickenella mellea]